MQFELIRRVLNMEKNLLLLVKMTIIIPNHHFILQAFYSRRACWRHFHRLAPVG